ncbi:hypothetical protein M8C21_010773, partial [Ambrosia artemisiifolia]
MVPSIIFVADTSQQSYIVPKNYFGIMEPLRSEERWKANSNKDFCLYSGSRYLKRNGHFICSSFDDLEDLEVLYGIRKDGEGYKVQFSGPLVSSNADQMLKDYDCHLQEVARRSHFE